MRIILRFKIFFGICKIFLDCPFSASVPSWCKHFFFLKLLSLSNVWDRTFCVCQITHIDHPSLKIIWCVFASMALLFFAKFQFRKKKGRSEVCKLSEQGILSQWHFSYALPPRHKNPIMAGLSYRKQYNKSTVLTCRFSHSLSLLFKNPFFCLQQNLFFFFYLQQSSSARSLPNLQILQFTFF